MQPGKSCSSCILLFAWPGEPVPTNGKNEPNDRAILHAMSSLTATSKGAATREAILDRAYDIARFAGIEGLSIGPLAQAVGMSKSGVFAHFRSEEHTSELQSLMR